MKECCGSCPTPAPRIDSNGHYHVSECGGSKHKEDVLCLRASHVKIHNNFDWGVLTHGHTGNMWDLSARITAVKLFTLAECSEWNSVYVKYHVNGTTRKSIPGFGADTVQFFFLVIRHSTFIFLILHTHRSPFCVKFIAIITVMLVTTCWQHCAFTSILCRHIPSSLIILFIFSTF